MTDSPPSAFEKLFDRTLDAMGRVSDAHTERILNAITEQREDIRSLAEVMRESSAATREQGSAFMHLATAVEVQTQAMREERKPDRWLTMALVVGVLALAGVQVVGQWGDRSMSLAPGRTLQDIEAPDDPLGEPTAFPLPSPTPDAPDALLAPASAMDAMDLHESAEDG